MYVPFNLADADQVVGGALSLIAVLWIIAIAATVFWLWALIHALTHERTTEEKLLWFLVIFFLHIVGAIIYFVVRRSKTVSV
jgi:hypothetical protein